jgi:hypothetical protein
MPFSVKEYSKGDSRYAARDTAIVALEAITVGLKGPASLLAVYLSRNSHLFPITRKN